MNLAPEIKNILAVQNILISISFSWTKLRKNYYHSQQHVPSKYLINDGTPASLPPVSRGELWEQGAPLGHPPHIFYHTINVLNDSQFLLPVYRYSFDASNLYFLCRWSE